METKKLWNTKQFADFVGWAYPTARRAVSEGRVPYFKIGASVRFDPDEVLQWLETKHREPVGSV